MENFIGSLLKVLLVVILLMITTTTPSFSSQENKLAEQRLIEFMILYGENSSANIQMEYISPKFFSVNKIDKTLCKNNNYIFESFAILKTNLPYIDVFYQNETYGWGGVFQFKMTKENGQYYIYPSAHRYKKGAIYDNGDWFDYYIDPYNSKTEIQKNELHDFKKKIKNLVKLENTMDAFGFKVGADTYETAIQKLIRDNSAFQKDLVYKGNSELRMIKINQYSKFDQIGKYMHSNLFFAPNNILYKVEVIFNHDDKLFFKIMNALKQKYSYTQESSYSAYLTYRDCNIKIKNSYMGQTDAFELSYTFQELEKIAEEKKEEIEREINRNEGKKLTPLL